jgi:hypothetical protein
MAIYPGSSLGAQGVILPVPSPFLWSSGPVNQDSRPGVFCLRYTRPLHSINIMLNSVFRVSFALLWTLFHVSDSKRGPIMQYFDGALTVLSRCFNNTFTILLNMFTRKPTPVTQDQFKTYSRAYHDQFTSNSCTGLAK